MTSYAEYKCEYVECGYIWELRPQHICPECSRQQFWNGRIFARFKENLHTRISFYLGLDTPDEAKDYLEECYRCIADLEELRLVYESDLAYQQGKHLAGFDLLGHHYHDLIRSQSFDAELFDISEFFLKHV